MQVNRGWEEGKYRGGAIYFMKRKGKWEKEEQKKKNQSHRARETTFEFQKGSTIMMFQRKRGLVSSSKQTFPNNPSRPA